MDMTDGISITVGASAVSAIASAALTYWKAKQPKKIEPQPLGVEGEISKKPKYVTVQEFNKHVADNEREHAQIKADNERDHENLFGRLNRNDMVTSEINGKLTGIKEDLALIKSKLFRSRG